MKSDGQSNLPTSNNAFQEAGIFHDVNAGLRMARTYRGATSVDCNHQVLRMASDGRGTVPVPTDTRASQGTNLLHGANFRGSHLFLNRDLSVRDHHASRTASDSKDFALVGYNNLQETKPRHVHRSGTGGALHAYVMERELAAAKRRACAIELERVLARQKACEDQLRAQLILQLQSRLATAVTRGPIQEDGPRSASTTLFHPSIRYSLPPMVGSVNNSAVEYNIMNGSNSASFNK